MKAVILAAGRGSRMKNLTDERPKCMVELFGKPLLQWQLEAINEAGIREIGIVTGYKRDMLANYGLHVFKNTRWSETQMVTSLSCASEWLEKETCIVSYSDIFYGSDAVSKLMNEAADIALTYDPNWRQLWTDRFGNPLLDAETFKLREDGKLLEIGNKPKTVEEIQGQYMGLLRFTPAGWAQVQNMRNKMTDEEKDRIHMTAIIQMLLCHKVDITALPYDGKWGEIDSIQDLKLYE